MSDQNNGNGRNNKEAPKPSEQTPPERTPAQSQPEIIPPALDSALRNLGIDTRDPNVSKALEISLTMMFSGSLPLPPPAILKEYDSIRPGLVDKFIDWTEQQSAHRKALESIRTERSEDRLDRGQWIAASVAVGGLILSSLVAVLGNPWVAAVIAIVAVGGPTAAIWLVRNIRHQSPPAPQRPGPPKLS